MPPDELADRELWKRLAALKERKRYLDACRAAALRWDVTATGLPTEQARRGMGDSVGCELESLRHQIRLVRSSQLGYSRWARDRPSRKSRRYFAPAVRRNLTRPQPQVSVRTESLSRPRERRFRRSQRSTRSRGDPSPEPEPPLDLLDVAVRALGWGRV
jgi:hypothetical protein